MFRKSLLALVAVLCISSCGKTNDMTPMVICTGDDYAEGSWYAFRKDFDIQGDPSKAVLRIESDTKYWLWVNGEMEVREGNLKRGPSPTGGYYDLVEDLGNLKKGHNEVAVLVNFHGRYSTNHMTSRTAGLYFDLTTNRDRIVSDSTWKAIAHPAFYVPEGGCPNVRLSESNVGYDARNEICFHVMGYDASSWPSAIAMSVEDAGWGEMVERPVGQWKDYGLKEYVSTQMKGRELVCTLPYDLQMTAYMKVKAPAGKIIDIYTDLYGTPVIEGIEIDPEYDKVTLANMAKYGLYRNQDGYDPNHNRTISETLAMTDAEHKSRTASFPLLCSRGQYITKEGVQEYEMPMWLNGMEVHYSIPEGVEVLDVKYRESGYDTEFAGSFESSDEFLNTLWEKAQRTLYVNMRDNYFDCPHRERGQWIGDAANESYQTYYALDTKSHALTAKAIRELAAFQRPNGSLFGPCPGYDFFGEHVTQTTAFVSYAIDEYYMQTGDITPLEDVYENLRKYVRVWKIGEDGLVEERHNEPDAPVANWGDWGENKDMNLLYSTWHVVLLGQMEKYAQLMDDPQEAAWAKGRREKLVEAINDKCWNGSYYVSDGYTLDPDDRGQAVAVLGGTLSPDLYETIRPFFKEHFNASPYMEYYVLDALCRMGYYQDALDRMRTRFEEMVNADYSTLWEVWGDGSGKTDSYNHSWSGGPLVILSKYIAGIYPLEPGYSRFKVAPHLCDLNSVSSTVATVKGDITLSVSKESSGMILSLCVPEGSVAEIELPEEYGSITVNGEKATRETLSDLRHGVYDVVLE